MMRILFILLVGFISLYANEVTIDNTFEKSFFNPKSQYYIAKDSLETVDEIRQKTFKTHLKPNFPKSKNTVWTKLTLVNTKKNDIQLFLRNIRAGIDYIDVYIYKNNHLEATFLLGDLRAQETKSILSKKSTFSHAFKQNSTYEIYFKYQSLGAISNQWEIFTQKEFIKFETTESVIWGVVSGIIIAIIGYNFIVFLLTKNYAFLYYILSSIFSLLFLLALNGLLYQLDMGINLHLITLGTWIFAYLYLAFMFLFVLKFFNESVNTVIYKLIRVFLLVLVVMLTLFAYGFYNTDFIYTVSKLDIVISLSSFFILLVAVFRFSLNKKDSHYFLMGQLLYLSAFTYYIFQVIGMVPMNYYSWIVLPLGFLLELIFISIALNIKLKGIEVEKEQMQQVLLEQSRFTNTGKTISYIVHQLKKPIAQLGSQINLIEATLLFNEKNLKDVVQEVLPKTKTTFEYIHEVGSSVSTMYLNPNGIEAFDVHQQIKNLLLLQQDFLDEHNIEVGQHIEKLQVSSYKGTFNNILMVIIENAIYELSKCEGGRNIFITSQKCKNGIIVAIEDNAGGIEELDKIFDINYSTKGNEGSGLGLSLASNLIKKKLKGKISVSNTNQGAKFTLFIPSL